MSSQHSRNHGLHRKEWHNHLDDLEWCLLGKTAAALTAAWLVLFYGLCITQPCWMRRVPTSTKQHENNRYWCARLWIGGLHATLVSATSIPGFLILLSAPDNVKFFTSDNVGYCRSEGPLADTRWELTFYAIAFAGLAFTTFTITDVFVSLAHRLATRDYLVHHGAFIVIGVLMRVNCMMFFNASIMLVMEVSTPFLNCMLFYRYRGRQYQRRAALSGGLFFVLFVLCRLGLNTYGAYILLVARERAAPNTPVAEVWTVIVCVCLGLLVQFFWFPKIILVLCGKLRASVTGRTLSVELAPEDEGQAEGEVELADVARRSHTTSPPKPAIKKALT